MTLPVFEEYEPASDCGCAGCVEVRRSASRTLSLREGGHPAVHGARRALVLATAAGVVLGCGTVAAATGPAGDAREPAAAPVEATKLPATTRTAIISRAKQWVAARVPYRMDRDWKDGYRQDCSGFVSMAWGLDGSEWTGGLAEYGVRTGKSDLQPGDILLFHNPADPNKGSHVTIFGGWSNSARTTYLAYEQTKPHTRAKATPYAYWTNSSRYVAYRYKGLSTGSAGSVPVTGYPGTKSFGRGAKNGNVTRLGRMLVTRGGGRFYRQGPGPRWGEADRRATRAFQRAQGWNGDDANGLPGPSTWRLLVKGSGKDIPAAAKGGVSAGPARNSTRNPTRNPTRNIAKSIPVRSTKNTAESVSASSAKGVTVSTAEKTGKATAGSTGRAGSISRSTAAGRVDSASGGDGGSSTPRGKAFPGARFFRPGRTGVHVRELGEQLVKKGFGKYYTTGPGARWSEADRRNVEAFQRSQGWTGAAADGYPGPETWRRLFA